MINQNTNMTSTSTDEEPATRRPAILVSTGYGNKIDIKDPRFGECIDKIWAEYRTFNSDFRNTAKCANSNSNYRSRLIKKIKKEPSISGWIDKLKKKHDKGLSRYQYQDPSMANKFVFALKKNPKGDYVTDSVIANNDLFINEFEGDRNRDDEILVASDNIEDLIPTPDPNVMHQSDEWKYLFEWTIYSKKVFQILDAYAAYIPANHILLNLKTHALYEGIGRRSMIPDYYISKDGFHVVDEIYSRKDRTWKKELPSPVKEDVAEINRQMNEWLAHLNKIERIQGSDEYMRGTHFELTVELYEKSLPTTPFDYLAFVSWDNVKFKTSVFTKFWHQDLNVLVPPPDSCPLLYGFVKWSIRNPHYVEIQDKFLGCVAEEFVPELLIKK